MTEQNTFPKKKITLAARLSGKATQLCRKIQRGSPKWLPLVKVILELTLKTYFG